MAIQIKDTAPAQTAQGQPVIEGGADENITSTITEVAESNESGTTETPDSKGNEPQSTDSNQTTGDKVTPVDVNIDPAALRQITNLSTTNRALKAKIAELEAKQASLVPTEEIQAKLKQLADLENETPRQYLARTKKTLDDIAADVLADDANVVDPRVDALAAEIEALKKKDAEAAENKTKNEAAEQAAKLQAQIESAKQHVAEIVKAQPTRWELIANDANIGAEVVKAAMLVKQRDHGDKPITKEQAEEIVHSCLDEAETYALAKKMVEDRKNSGEKPESLVKKRGLVVEDSSSYKPDRGDDGKGADGRRPPQVTIDGNRGAIRRGAVKRGPTDVRTARARALKIAGAGEDDFK